LITEGTEGSKLVLIDHLTALRSGQMKAIGSALVGIIPIVMNMMSIIPVGINALLRSKQKR
jgi:hypothetical protein